MAKNNVVFNVSLEQYNKKYRNRKHRLVKYTKKEVEEFDDKYPSSTKHRLLKNRKWALIGDTYYEIPKAPRYTWFRNLNAACQVGTCVLAAGVVASAIAVPTVILLNNNNAQDSTDERIIEISVKDVTASKPVKEGDNLVVMLSSSNYKKTVSGIEKIMIGYIPLKAEDYSFNETTGKLIIKKSGLEKGDKNDHISITPKLIDKEATIILNKDNVTIGDQGKYYQLKIKNMPKGFKNENVVWISSDSRLTVENGKIFTKANFRGDFHATVTVRVGKEYGVCEVNVESTYNIDWIDKKHFDSGLSLYDFFRSEGTERTAEFLYSDDESGEPCGETADDKIFCSCQNNVIKIWSKKKISFEDDDRPHDKEYGFFDSTGYITDYVFDNIDTSSIEDFSKTFRTMEVSVLDLSNFNTQNAKNMSQMFTGGAGPHSNGPKFIKGLTNFDTSNVENMYRMFYAIEKAFGCLDLSSFDTSNVKTMGSMFHDDSFTTIYVSDKFSVDKVLSDEGDKGDDMFENLSGVIGRKNTKYEDIKKDDPQNYASAKYAKLDGGESDPGYFSYKNDVTLEKLKFTNPSLTEPYTCEVSASDDGCKGHVRIPDTVKGTYVENGNPDIEYKVTAISDNGFNITGKTDFSINKVYLTPNIETIGKSAFYKAGIKEIDFGKNSKLKTIKENAFEEHNFLDLTLPSSLVTIEKQAFYSSAGSAIERICFETNPSLKTIGEEAFVFESLRILTIPKSVITIGKNAFFYLMYLNYVDCTEFNEEDNVPSGTELFKRCSDNFKIYTKNQTVCNKFKEAWTQYSDRIEVKPSI